MKKMFLAIVLVAAVTAVAQTTAAPAAPAPQSAAPQAAPQKKEIKDPAEYNAYVGALQQQDPAAMISGFEAFLTQYPNSVMKEDALVALMGAYQKAGNQAKTMDTAQKLLVANPCNLRGLAVLTYSKRALVDANQNAQQNLADAAQNGDKGLQCIPTAVKPDGTPDADWATLKTQTGVIFNGAVGLAALQAKDYAKAQQYLFAAVKDEGDDAGSLRDVYPLALAYLTATPSDGVNGSFFIARAASLAPAPANAQLESYGKKQYKNFHGSDEGWADVMAAAKGNKVPPAGFTVKKYEPPTPAQQAHDLVTTKKVEEMSFAEWQLVLSEGAPEDADKVWAVLKGKPLQMASQVITMDSSSKLTLAGSSDDIEAKKADIDLTMTAAIPAKSLPKVGGDFQFEGTPVSYVAKPFMMTMNEGKLLVKTAPPVKKSPVVRRKPAAN